MLSGSVSFAKENAAEEGFNRWTINGVAYPMTSEVGRATFRLERGKRYRIRIRNASDAGPGAMTDGVRFILNQLSECLPLGVANDERWPFLLSLH
jgi:hypothetical protein